MCQLFRRSSQLSNYPEKAHRDVTATQILTRVADSSRCVEHIINPLQHRVNHVKAVQIEDNMKSIGESQHMKSSSTKASDQCLLIGRKSDRESKLPNLMTCSGASDDDTNIIQAKGLIATMTHEVVRNPNQEF
jgi:hypothetical protein